MKIIVTGCAGFIGAFVSQYLLKQGHEVLGIDNLNDYYDVQLKKDRLKFLETNPKFKFHKLDVANYSGVKEQFQKFLPDRVIHLAAQAGVRYSLTHPFAYTSSNIDGFLSILECSREFKIQHLVYASTSSVYGLNESLPFNVHQSTEHPVSLYAATKKANELMAHSYSHLFKLPTTGLRFFTVYGPFGRPDMALFQFTKSILAGTPIDVFNNGNHKRDFTFVDDIVEGVCRVALGNPPTENPEWTGKKPDPSFSKAPYRLFNIGNSNSVELNRYIEVLEDCLGHKAIRNNLPLQAGDIVATEADVTDLEKAFNYRPSTPVEVGIKKFVDWYKSYYKVL